MQIGTPTDWVFGLWRMRERVTTCDSNAWPRLQRLRCAAAVSARQESHSASRPPMPFLARVRLCDCASPLVRSVPNDTVTRQASADSADVQTSAVATGAHGRRTHGASRGSASVRPGAAERPDSASGEFVTRLRATVNAFVHHMRPRGDSAETSRTRKPQRAPATPSVGLPYRLAPATFCQLKARDPSRDDEAARASSQGRWLASSRTPARTPACLRTDCDVSYRRSDSRVRRDAETTSDLRSWCPQGNSNPDCGGDYW